MNLLKGLPFPPIRDTDMNVPRRHYLTAALSFWSLFHT